MKNTKDEHYRVIALENDQTKAEFDVETGALLALINKETGWKIQDRPALAQSFRLVVPLPEQLLNVIDGVEQEVVYTHKDASRSRLNFIWESLKSKHVGTMDIRLSGVVTLVDEGLRFEMEIENRSPYLVESVAYPFIGDLARPASGGSLTQASCFHTSMIFKSLYPEFQNERGYWGVEFPIQMVPTPENPFLLILSEEEGLYVGHHDTCSKERVEFTFQLKPGYGKVGRVLPGEEYYGQAVNLEFSAVHHPFIQTGETNELSPIVLKLFTGDWHTGADIYKAWRDTWMKKPPIPEWTQQVHSWQQIQMSSWGDTLNLRYQDLAAFGEECARHGVGAIQLTGWTLYGQDGRLPIHDTDPRFGTREELKEAIRQIQGMDVKVVLYEKYTCADKSMDWYKDELHKYASKDIFNNTHGHEGWRYDTPAHLAGINTRPYAWMCMNSEKWQDVALEQIAKSFELGSDGILLDECQWHGANAFYCFDETHGHHVPAYNFGGDAHFERRLRKLLEKCDPELLLAGEGPYDLQNRHYALTYHRAGEGHIPAMRYVDPFLPMMSWVYGHDDRESINFCLLYRYIISYEPRHFRGRLEEFPLTLEYGKKVDALRVKYRAYLWDAEFRDTVGATVTVNGQPHTLYSVFQQAENKNKAIIIANHEDDDILAVVDTEEGEDEFLLATPEEPETQESDKAVRIPARSVAVLFPFT
jgi:hypothetical protein